MAVESVGLAASVAGLLSLGLQVTGGLVAYLDALKSRGEELASVKRQNDSLAAALSAIKAAFSSSLRNQHHIPAVMRSIQACEGELQAAEELLASLANCDTRTWRQRMKTKTKKLTYSFDRSKIQQINQRLHHANGVLQLTLTGLGL
ncbi:hypothetical protein PG997_014006 [Apiospora hydei]|uniref:Fungal N-terminal domain-containing protein n=1 Tax=Apiospora hydei TaxID=1337664 RepID=A0ABR1V7T8_9PEZI